MEGGLDQVGQQWGGKEQVDLGCFLELELQELMGRPQTMEKEGRMRLKSRNLTRFLAFGIGWSHLLK